MITASIAFLAALVCSLALTPFVRGAARRFGLLDRARSTRKIHIAPVPRIGGVAIAVAFIVPIAGLFGVDSEVGRIFLANLPVACGMLAGGLAIAALGFIDDLRGLPAIARLAVQTAVALAVWTCGISIDYIGSPWGAIQLGWLSAPVTIFWIVGITNALNFVDGLDGLASGVAIAAVGANFAIAALGGNVLMMLFMAALAGAVLGFLVYNFNPATIFMGDSGSMFLGFILATGSIVANAKSSATVSLLAPVLALGLPILDTTLAVVRRSLRGLPVLSADREHLHHKLLSLGYSHRRAVLVLYAACAACAGLALASVFANGVGSALIVLMAIVAASILVRWLGYFPRGSGYKDVRAHNHIVRDRTQAAADAVDAAPGLQEAWGGLVEFGKALGASELTLTVFDPGDGSERLFAWRPEGHTRGTARASFFLRRKGEPLGSLAACWDDGREAPTREDELALERVAERLALATRRWSRLAPRRKGRAL